MIYPALRVDMDGVVFLSSAAIKLVTAAMLTYAIIRLTALPGPSAGNLINRYFIVKRQHAVLRASLSVVAALVLIELLTLVVGELTDRPFATDAETLVSDVLLVILVVLLSRLYRMRPAGA